MHYWFGQHNVPPCISLQKGVCKNKEKGMGADREKLNRTLVEA